MAVAFDALTKFGPFTADTSGTHTPVGTPKGVLVFVAQSGATADEVDSVTYGGQALAQLELATDTVTELLAGYLFFLGSGIPAGAQTVAINETGGTSKVAWCITVTAAADTAVEDSGATGENQADPSVALTTGAGVETYVASLLVSGLGSPGSFSGGAMFTALDNHDFGQQSAGVMDIDANDAGGGVTVAWNTGATSDDVAMVAGAIKESAGAAGDTLTAGGALAAGNTLSAAATSTVGGAAAQGNIPSPSALLTTGGGLAQGNSLASAVPLTVGGAIAAGRTFGVEEGDTLTPGGATAAGNTLTVTAAAAAGGALAQGNTIAAAVPITGGSANAQGNQPSPAVALLTAGGAIAAGNTITEDADIVTGRFDRPTPGGGIGSAVGAGLFDRPTPGGAA